MATAQATTAMDAAVSEELSRRFAEVFKTQEAGQDLFTSDALFDLNMPVWRFQLEGPEAFAQGGPGEALLRPVEPVGRKQL